MGTAFLLPIRIGLFYSFVVFAGTGIDTYLVAGVDEEWHLDGGAGVHRCGLQRVRRSGIALYAGFCIGYLHIDNGWEFSREGNLLVGVEHDFYYLTVGHEVGVFYHVLVYGDFLESFGVHEMCAHVVLIGELVGAALNPYGFYLLACRESFVEDTAVFEVFELGAYESGAFALFTVQELYDSDRLSIDF